MNDHLPKRFVGVTDALDHVKEFVRRVAEETPGHYADMLKSPLIQRLMREDNAFNAGKLYAWAEYCVFRSEFRKRFPEAPPRSCLNAFCKLFLKNDISMSNLARVLEEPSGDDWDRLEQPQKKPAG